MVTSVKNLSAAVTALNKELGSTSRLLKSITGYSKQVKGLTDSVKSMSGGLGSSGKLFDDAASFATETQKSASGVKGAQASSAAQKEQAGNTKMPWLSSKGFIGAKFGAQVGLAVGAAGYAALPDTGAVIGRAAGFYAGATIGGVNQNRLRQAVFSGLAGGITGAGDDAAAAAMLIQGYRYAPNSAAFNMRVREIGGAARFLNIANPVAAEALGGLGTGSMASNLAQYGMFVSDPRTGKDLGFEQIARQIYNRAYGGQKGITREDVATDIRSGFLGADLRKLGFDSTQVDLFQSAFGNFAEGKGFDLGNLQGKDNPLAAQMQIATSQTALMERATQPMIKGFEQAADVVEKFNKSLEGLPDAMFQLKASVQTLAGTNVGAAAGGLLGGLGMAFGGLTSALGARSLLKATGATGPANAVKASGVKNLLGKAGLAGLTYTGLEFVQGQLNKADVPDDVRYFANALFDMGQGGVTGLATGNPLVGLGGVFAGGVGAAQKPYGSRGGGTTGFGASFGARGGGAQSPVPGMAPTSGFGAKDTSGIWSGSNNKHTGQDYPMPIGSDVQAAMDGVVIDDAPGYEYGITVQVDHENGFQTLYGHLSKALVNPGDRVKKGQVIGKSGDTGNVTGPHLHFEVRKGSNNPVDPQQLLSSPFTSALSLQTYSPAPITSQGNYLTTSQSTPKKGKTAKSGSTKPGQSPTGDKKEWITSFLSSIGAPTTKDNVYAMSEWIRFESGDKWSRWNNPLNTTLDRPGAESMNSVGVKKYLSGSEGLEATIATLTGNRAGQRGYTAILDSLRAGASYTQTFDAIRESAWVGGEEKKSPYQFNYNRGPSGGGRTGFGASVAAPAAPSTVGNRTVNVTLNIQQASEEEAVRFAKKIKYYLESERDHDVMGSK
jgi:murein DD-endopeptidase MepM/ murein hydrolase activator NlpD